MIHGDSAGAGSIAHHMTANWDDDDPLFVGAVHESTFWPTLRTVAEMEFQFDRLVKDTGCSGSESQLTCLRTTDIAAFQKGNVQSPFPGGSNNLLPVGYFLPVIDGTLIEDQLYQLFERGRAAAIPLLIGDDTDEGSMFAYNASTASDASLFFKANYPNLSLDSIDAINLAYPLMAPLPLHGPYFPSLSAAYGDAALTCPGIFIATTATSRQLSNVWNYRYDVQDPQLIRQGLGVPHIFELSAIFGIGYAGNSETSGYREANEDIVPIVTDYWISFMKTLSPNPARNSRAPFWEPWGSGIGERLKIRTNTTEMESVPPRLASRCSLWRNLSREMEV